MKIGPVHQELVSGAALQTALECRARSSPLSFFHQKKRIKLKFTTIIISVLIAIDRVVILPAEVESGFSSVVFCGFRG